MIKKTVRFLLFLTLILWIGGYGAFLSNVTTVTPDTPSIKTDAIVVLTGGNYRIATGLSLFSQGLSPELFITGVHNSVKEKEIKALWKGEEDLPECCITLGHEATTTIGNALETQKWSQENDIKSIRLVTSTYHMHRALLEFRNVLHDTEIIVHPVEKPDYGHNDLLFWKLTFDEYNKVIFRMVVLNMKAQGILK